MTGAMIVLIWRRLQRVNRRVQALIAEIRSGTLRIAATPRACVRRPDAPCGTPRLPRRFGWLLPLMPGEAACYAGQLRAVLSDPEMLDLIAVTPRLGRALRPLCRMLGVEPDVLAPRLLGFAALSDSASGETGVRVAALAYAPRPSIAGFSASSTFAEAHVPRPLVPT